MLPYTANGLIQRIFGPHNHHCATCLHTLLIIGVIEGSGVTFSLEGPDVKAFHTRSLVFTDSERSE